MPDPSALLSHRYFMSSDYSDGQGTVELPPPPWQKSLLAEMRYPYDVLEQALPLVHARGLHFFFTKNAYRLPEYGPHVVSVLLQEERAKVPVYGRYIRATIRNLMSKPFIGWRPHLPLSSVEAVLTFEYLRDSYTHARSVLARQFPPGACGTPVRRHPLVLRIPLGYHSQVEVPYVPIRDREIDMFFAGEIRHPVARSDYRHWTSTSKFEVRGQLWRELEKLKDDWRIDQGAIASVDSKTNQESFDSYSHKMMNTRICLAPRGSLPDTYRHFEGMRASCLIVSNPVPVEPYLHGAPMLILDHWRELAGLLKKYGNNYDFIEETGAKANVWWQTRLTPEVIGHQVATQLNRDPELGSS